MASHAATLSGSDRQTGAVPSTIPAAWLWLALGGVAGVFACGGRWDIAAAAWLAPVALLRFSRTSSRAVAAFGLVIASLTQTIAYFVLTAIPFTPLTSALCGIVGLAYAVPGLVDRLLGERLGERARTVLFPAAMVAIEYAVGSVLPVGTAIGMRAITQGENLALLQVSAITGPYVVAFLIGWMATVANRLIKAPSSATLVRHGLPLAAVLGTVIVGGQARLAFAPDIARTVRVAAITPDGSARRAIDDLFVRGGGAHTEAAALRAARTRVAARLLADTRRAARAGAAIVVWSETAASSDGPGKPVLLAQVARVAREERVFVAATVGVPHARNESFLFAPDGALLWHYRKNHPVPGLEPVAPFANPVPVVATPFGRLATLICFDGDFPALARVDADLMLEPSWDWPEVTRAHTLRMIRLRAIENGYALVRPVFDGISGAFDPLGRTLAVQTTMTPGAHMLLVEVPIGRARTLYNQIGDVFAWLCALGAAGLAITAVRRRARVRSSGCP